jgi:TonB-dependent SusC/RagA subfamily outer membrane receptor
VVDGVPITATCATSTRQHRDHRRAQDASAAAVYGSRGANGVVMITTKRGDCRSSGSHDFTLSQHVRRFADPRGSPMMSGQEFANFRRESYRNSNTASYATACANYATNPTPCDAVALDPTMRANLAAGVNTNWQDLMLRDGNLQNTQLGFSGGRRTTRFRAASASSARTHQHRAGLHARARLIQREPQAGRLSLQLGIQGAQNHRDVGRGSVMWDEALFNPRSVATSTRRAAGFPAHGRRPPREPGHGRPAYQRGIDRTNVLGTLTARSTSPRAQVQRGVRPAVHQPDGR